MKNKLGLALVIFALVLAFSRPSMAAGNLVDDAITGMVVTAPSSYSGAQHGYQSLGSAQMRWPSTNDHLFTIEKPHLRGGCGGIDIYMGSFSYLKFEYLVQKAQRIIQNAEALAIMVAWDTLMAQVNKQMAYLNTATDWMNSLQLDDCKAGKSLLAVVQEPTKSVKDAQRYMESISTRVNNKGSDSYLEAQTAVADTAGNAVTGDTAPGGPLASCPADLNAVFLAPNTSLLANMGTKFGYSSSSYTDLMRGFVGDIRIVQPGGSGTLDYQMMDPCRENSTVSVSNFIDGNVYTRPEAGGNCTLTSDTNRNLFNWAKTQVDGITASMKVKSIPTAAQQTFLVNTGTYNHIYYAVAAGVESDASFDIAGIAARSYGYKILQSMYERTDEMIRSAQEIMAKTASSDSCRVDIVAAHAGQLELLKQRIHTFATALRDEYRREDQEYSNHLAAAITRVNLSKEIAAKDLTKTFNGAITRKISQGGK